jgi:CBS domain containing-hemolysin-like protein
VLRAQADPNRFIFAGSACTHHVPTHLYRRIHTPHSPEELRLLVGRSAQAGLLSAGDRKLVDRAFLFGGTTAGEVVVPRTEVIALAAEASLPDVIRTVRRHRFGRFPVYQGSIDNVIGVLSTTDLVGLSRGVHLPRLVRPPVLVPAGAEVSEVVDQMRAARQPLAVVLDEFGGTAGIVTLRDLVFARPRRRPHIGDVVQLGSGYEGTVAALDGLRIATIRLVKS